jgi:hypothetical protein
LWNLSSKVIAILLTLLFSVSTLGQNPPVGNHKPNDSPDLVERTDDRTPKGWRAYEFDVDETHRLSFILPASDVAQSEAPYELPLDGKTLRVNRRLFAVSVFPDSDGKRPPGLPLGTFFIVRDRYPSPSVATLDESRRLKLPGAQGDLIAAEVRRRFKEAGLREPTFGRDEPRGVRENGVTRYEQKFNSNGDTLHIRVIVVGETLVWANAQIIGWANSDESETFFSHFSVSKR